MSYLFVPVPIHADHSVCGTGVVNFQRILKTLIFYVIKLCYTIFRCNYVFMGYQISFLDTISKRKTEVEVIPSRTVTTSLELVGHSFESVPPHRLVEESLSLSGLTESVSCP